MGIHVIAHSRKAFGENAAEWSTSSSMFNTHSQSVYFQHPMHISTAHRSKHQIIQRRTEGSFPWRITPSPHLQLRNTPNTKAFGVAHSHCVLVFTHKMFWKMRSQPTDASYRQMIGYESNLLPKSGKHEWTTKLILVTE